MAKRASSLHSGESSLLRAILVEARRGAGLSQVDVAERLSRPQTFVSKYEVGERRVDLIEFVEIARALEADPVVLLKQYMKMLERNR